MSEKERLREEIELLRKITEVSMRLSENLEKLGRRLTPEEIEMVLDEERELS